MNMDVHHYQDMHTTFPHLYLRIVSLFFPIAPLLFPYSLKFRIEYNDLKMQFLFFSNIIFKMKVLILIILSICLTSSNLIGITSQCPQQFVADINSVCIRPSYIEGCIKYKFTQECFKCSKEYELQQGRCSLLDSYTENSPSNTGCLESGADGKCLNCANGFLRKGGVCQVGVLNCEQYEEGSKCKRCVSEYSLIFNECKHNLLLGCKNQQSDHTCSQCYKPFILSNGHCVINQCKSYNDFGCVSCECGFYLARDQSCQKIQKGCLKTNQGVCVECLPHFQLIGGVCQIQGCVQPANNNFCKVCDEKYELVNGVCNFKNCLDWKNERCIICSEGYNLVKGQCQKSEGKFVCQG